MTSAPPTGIISDHTTNKSSQCQCWKEKKIRLWIHIT